MMETLTLPKTIPVVYAEDERFFNEAKRLAEKLHTPFLDTPTKELSLVLSQEGLSLKQGELSMQGDFSKLLPRLKPNNLNGELVVKACKVKAPSPVVVDATAGMGEDSFLLAAAGFTVKLFEYDPVIFALLRDSLKRACEVPELKEIVGRMELFEEDSVEAMKNLPFTPDVVLLDPMFPERKKSGLIKKKFQLLQQLERPCGNENELLSSALLAKPKKIVIKRPAKGPYLGERKPDFSMLGKAVRYDCILEK